MVQRLRVAQLWAGPGSALGGLTAASLDRFKGFGNRDAEDEAAIHVRIARSLIDAASWMATDRGAQAVLAPGIQQRLVTVGELTDVVAANRRLRRRQLIRDTLADVAGGAQALSELDFTRLVIRGFGLPEPDRQSRRKGPDGKVRYLDAVWERERVVVEVDGAQHADPLQHWDDMDRDNDLVADGYRVLRFPAWLVRYRPDLVAARIRSALRM